ncbi:acyl carrier protein [Streptomyces cremeus]|uniref:Acyl carrier protein n=1 Tax=Streptomyces cremeus TaxID=66881 RepID=A0ABV5PKC2_STRCM
MDAELFDCLQVNLAAHADRLHGAGTHLLLGAGLRFRPAPGPLGLPTVERGVRAQLTEATRRLGLVAGEPHTAASAADLTPADGCYVVADAFHLPWVPYYRQRHMEHSFLLENDGTDGVLIRDSYHNETPWGIAKPGRWTLTRQEFAAAVPGPALAVRLGAAQPGAGHGGSPAAAEPETDFADPSAVDAYADAYRRHPDRVAALTRLTLETWLLARARALHAAYLCHTGRLPDGDAPRAHLTAWKKLTEQVYLAHRRVERGRPEPQGLTDRLAALLHADPRVFGHGAEPVSAASAVRTAEPRTPDVPEGLRSAVAATAARVLGTDEATLLAGAAFDSVPSFSSFRVVEIVERLESELGIEFAADDLVPENLHHVDAVCRVVQRSNDGGARRALALDGEGR